MSRDQKVINRLVAHLRAQQKGAGQEVPEPHANGQASEGSGVSALTDRDVLKLMFNESKRGREFEDVYNGNFEPYHPSPSEAVGSLLWRLAFYTRKDPAQMERLIRGSALPKEKFDTRRGGTTWLGREISRAIEGTDEVYELPGEARRLLSSPVDSLKRSGGDDNDEDPLSDLVWFSKLGEPKEREYLIESVAVKKYTIVAYGAGGVAKSLAVLAAGIAIAGSSETWLGLSVLDHGYVLYLDFELDEEEQHRRVRDLCAGLGVEIPERLAYFSALGMSTEKAFEKARAFVTKYDAKAVIVDSMGLAMTGDMDRARDVIAFHRHFTDPLRALGTTPFVVDHEGKLQAGEKRKEKGPTGSAFKSWTTRSVLQFILEEYDEANSALDIRVRQHKSNFKPTKPFGVRFTFREQEISVEPIELPDTELLDEVYVPVKERIVAALEPGEATIKELAGLTGAETGTIRNKISELKSEGRVIDAGYRSREKLYSLPTNEPALAKESER